MPAGAPFNAAMAKARELVTRLRCEADQSAVDEAASARARELDAEEYAARVSSMPHQPTTVDDEAGGSRQAPR